MTNGMESKKMQLRIRLRAYFLMSAVILVAYSMPLLGQTNSAATPAAKPAVAAQRDGSHDFDPLLGSWKYHLKRRLHPLTGSNQWVEFDGTGECRKIFDGAQIDQGEWNGPTGRIVGLTLRVYNPQSHQWRLYWDNQKVGVLDPPQVGEFKDGVGEFFAQDTIDGKTILIRFHWTNLNTSTPHFEQSFSNDGGSTWEVNWITDQTRVEDLPDKAR